MRNIAIFTCAFAFMFNGIAFSSDEMKAATENVVSTNLEFIKLNFENQIAKLTSKIQKLQDELAEEDSARYRMKLEKKIQKLENRLQVLKNTRDSFDIISSGSI